MFIPDQAPKKTLDNLQSCSFDAAFDTPLDRDIYICGKRNSGKTFAGQAILRKIAQQFDMIVFAQTRASQGDEEKQWREACCGVKTIVVHPLELRAPIMGNVLIVHDDCDNTLAHTLKIYKQIALNNCHVRVRFMMIGQWTGIVVPNPADYGIVLFTGNNPSNINSVFGEGLFGFDPDGKRKSGSDADYGMTMVVRTNGGYFVSWVLKAPPPPPKKKSLTEIAPRATTAVRLATLQNSYYAIIYDVDLKQLFCWVKSEWFPIYEQEQE